MSYEKLVGYPSAVPQAQADPRLGTAKITGSFEGMQYRIDNRDTNTLLYLELQEGYEVHTKPGALVFMTSGVKIQGKLNFSWKKFFSGGQVMFAHFWGPGEVVLAPVTWGDIAHIHMDGTSPWYFGKHAFLACTPGIQLNTKSQSIGKALFSGNGLFVGVAQGAGILFAHGMGAVIARHLEEGEDWVVNNDHLVAWNCPYSMELIQAGSFVSKVQTGEGVVCRLKGPGTVFIQSRSPQQLANWISEHVVGSR